MGPQALAQVFQISFCLLACLDADSKRVHDFLASVQVPLQNNAEDWMLGNLSCYDAACVARLQTKLRTNFRGIAEGTLHDCLARNLPSDFEAMLVAETLKADPDALGRLMADHTQVTYRSTPPGVHAC